jgi:hypothetical protein
MPSQVKMVLVPGNGNTVFSLSSLDRYHSSLLFYLFRLSGFGVAPSKFNFVFVFQWDSVTFLDFFFPLSKQKSLASFFRIPGFLRLSTTFFTPGKDG